MNDAVVLDVGEKERLVFHDGAAEAAAKLILAPFRPGSHSGLRKPVARVEDVVTEILEGRSVKCVGSRLGDNVDHCTGGKAHIGAQVVGLHLHFGDGVNRGRNTHESLRAHVVVHAVDQLVVVQVRLAIG